MNPLDADIVEKLIDLNPQGYLFHREKSDLEFKEQFNFAGLAEYMKDFAAFANNSGGYLVFGVKDSPRLPNGMNSGSVEMFDRIDEETISGAINELFSPSIDWEKTVLERYDKKFGILYVYESKLKPIIAKKDEGRNQPIKNGEIYYRYAGRTQKIEYAELEAIINNRIGSTNREWMDLMAKVAKIGPANAAILDTERGIIERDKNNVLVVDEGLVGKIKFIREGDFSRKKGATTLRLVGDVQPIDQVEVTKVLRENITDRYPYSYKEMTDIIKSNIDGVKLHEIDTIIKDSKMKDNQDYSAYNFRNKQQEESYKTTGVLPSVTPSIYNETAIEFIISKLDKR